MAVPSFTKIAKYRILDLVGEGAMGIVYRAEDTVLNRVVAVKVMSESIARQEDLRDRFLREAQAAGSLTHPNIVTIYDFGETEGHLYIAMEFVPGTDLEVMLVRRDQLRVQTKLDILIDVLNGLAYAHKRGVVHRDVKPANIRITEDGHAKLMDFGVAHLTASTITRTGEQMGTPSYMAPEQVLGGKVTPASDIFAVGTVMYELFTGSKPFVGETLHTVMYQIVNHEPPPLPEMMPGVPPALDRVLRRALAKEVDDRYQSALEMANDLTQVRATLSGPVGPGTMSLRKPIAVARETPRSTAAATPSKLPWISGAVAVCALGAVGWMAMQRQSPAAAARNDSTSAPVASTATGPGAASLAPGLSAAPAPIANQAATPAAGAGAPPVQRRTAGGALSTAQAANAPTRVAADARKPAPVMPTTKGGTSSTSTQAATVLSPPVELPRPAVTQAAPPPVPAPTIPSPPPSSAAAPVAAAPDPARIPDAIDAYARALESRDVNRVRQAYPGLTAAQQKSFEQFFDATKQLRVSLALSDVDATGSSAEAKLSGTYEFVTSDGRSQRQPVSFKASLRHEGGRWRLTSVR